MSLISRTHGHFWTLWPFVRDSLREPRLEPERDWQTTVDDPSAGTSVLTGSLFEPNHGSKDSLLVLVHGLGGSTESGYLRRCAAIAHSMGVSTLRINLRGADRSGVDFYHAGLVEDLGAVFSCQHVKRFAHRYLLGFSMGGHVALRFAALHPDEIDAVASICAPLDLDEACRFIDQSGQSVYRRHLLRRLAAMYEAAKRNNNQATLFPASVAQAKAVRYLREWDNTVIVPRFGFADAEDYYQRTSVAPLLGEISVPTLITAAKQDPMVAAASMQSALQAVSQKVETRWFSQGGHVGFPNRLSVETSTLEWLLQRK